MQNTFIASLLLSSKPIGSAADLVAPGAALKSKGGETSMAYQSISNYGIIGDMRSAALVSV